VERSFGVVIYASELEGPLTTVSHLRYLIDMSTPTATPTWANASERQRTDKELMSHISDTDGPPRTRLNKRQDICKPQVVGIAKRIASVWTGK
jgi:hypothetical protein